MATQTADLWHETAIANVSKLRTVERIKQHIRLYAALLEITENEDNGCGRCRYCASEDTPYKDGKPMEVINGNVEDAEEWVFDQHEEWCPCAVFERRLSS